MFGALGFLTIIGRGRVPDARTLPYFPIVGALIGIAVGWTWRGTGELWPPLVAAAFTIIADVVITGMLHLDGLSDSADGLIAPMDRERRLQVMRDPSVGAFAAVTLIVVLLTRFAVFASAPATPWLIGAVWCLSRTAMVVVMVTGRYARGTGLATAFLGSGAQTWLVPIVICAVIAVPLALIDLGAWGLIPLAATVLGAVAVTVFARRRIGGFTGDTVGATGVVAETAGLIALAAL